MARKLLLADDSITIQKVVELVLAEEDFVIKAVSNGEDALNILESFRPDIVLADIEMPKMNGYQLCDKIKKNPSFSPVPVILLAGAFEPIDEDLARSVGADDTVIKPFESQELISKLNAALTMSAAGEEEIAIAAEEYVEAAAGGEEVLELSEASAEAGETVSAAGEEDLWEMEDVPELAAEETEAELIEEAGSEGFFELTEETPAPQAAAFAAVTEPAPRVSREKTAREMEVPSKEELVASFEKTVNKRIAEFLSSLDIREAVLSSLMPAMKESLEKMLWEIAPELTEKMLHEILKGSISSLSAEVEKVIWETVPDLANTMISKEIEKIKAEF